MALLVSDPGMLGLDSAGRSQSSKQMPKISVFCQTHLDLRHYDHFDSLVSKEAEALALSRVELDIGY